MPRDSLVFYTNPMSRGRIVRWMLEEVGQPYRTEILDYGTTMKAPDYLRDQPDGQGAGDPPRRRRGHRSAPRSAPIWPTPFPRPAWRRRRGDRQRGPYYRWLFFAAGPLEAAATNKAFGFEVPAERKAMAGYGSLADVIDALEAALAGREYLVGDRFTAADLYVGSHIGWGMQFGTIEKRPAFERYFGRLAPARRRSGRARSTTPWWQRKRRRRDKLSALR